MPERDDLPEFVIIRGEGLRAMTPGQYQTLRKSLGRMGLEFVTDGSVEVARKNLPIPENFELDPESPNLDSVTIEETGEELKVVTYESFRRFAMAKGIKPNKLGPVGNIIENLAYELADRPIPKAVGLDVSPTKLGEEVVLVKGSRKRTPSTPVSNYPRPVLGIVPDAFIREVKLAFSGERHLDWFGPGSQHHISHYIYSLARVEKPD